MFKKILFAIIIILVVLGIAYGVVSFFSADKNFSLQDELKNTLPFGEPTEDVSKKFGLPDFLRFGKKEPLLPSDEGGDIGDSLSTTSVLRQITNTAVAGSAIFSEKEVAKNDATTGTSTQNIPTKNTVVYAERSTGHVYTFDLDTNSRERISNTTIPGAHNVLWGENIRTLLYRYLDDEMVIKSFAGTISQSTTTTQKEGGVTGIFLPDEISNVAISPKRDKIFALSNFGTIVIGTAFNFPNSVEKKELYTSSFTEWVPKWPNKNIITLTTKASYAVGGFLYFLDVEKETTEKVIGGVLGLTTLTSPTGNYVVYSESTRSGLATKLYNRKFNTTVDFSVSTLPEKCVWSTRTPTTIFCGVPQVLPSVNYPDEWYQGGLSFSDSLWKIDIATGAVTILATPEQYTKQKIDIVSLQLSKEEEYIIFKNKKDSTLWSLKLKTEY